MKKNLIYVLILFIMTSLACGQAKSDIKDDIAVKQEREAQTPVISEPEAEELSPANFAGDWDWLDSPPGKAFYLRIEQEGDKIKGSYCATAFYGARIDCGFEKGACPISGIVRGNMADVEFTSCFGGKKSKAKIVHHGETIEWVIKEFPVERWYFCPSRAILNRALKLWNKV